MTTGIKEELEKNDKACKDGEMTSEEGSVNAIKILLAYMSEQEKNINIPEPPITEIITEIDIMDINGHLKNQEIKTCVENLLNKTLEQLRSWWSINSPNWEGNALKGKARKLDHLEAEIFRRLRKINANKSALNLVETMPETPHNQDGKSKAGRLDVLRREGRLPK